MDVSTSSSADLAIFRDQVRSWLQCNMSPKSSVPENATLVSADAVHRARELQRRLFGGGYSGLAVDPEYGGRGLTADHDRLLWLEGQQFEMPVLFNVPTTRIIMPALLAHGSEQQKRAHVPAILDGRELWVQLLSEPSGGSDLAGLRTRATADGDRFIIDGQKVWSTGAHFVDFGLCLARTNWDVPKHRGLTAFIVPFDTPGITVAPIKQINEEEEFCEVFFDAVEIPRDNVVGDVDQGWAVALTILAHERQSAGAGRAGDPSAEMMELARSRNRLEDPHVQSLVADAYIRARLEARMARSISHAINTGQLPAPAGALLKLFRADKTQRAAKAALEVAGTSAVVWPHDDASAATWSTRYLDSRARSIAGGTNEMQRNVIGERLLGLPREPHADRDVAFSDVRHT